MSVGAYIPPTITVQYDVDQGFVLMATSHGRSAQAGHRILRGEPWPDVQFSHGTEESAETDAQKLRDYLDECATGKRKDREQEPRARGWWQ